MTRQQYITAGLAGGTWCLIAAMILRVILIMFDAPGWALIDLIVALGALRLHLLFERCEWE